MMKLSQNKETGILKVVETIPVDSSSINGAWVMCAGSVSPWGSHLGGEEYEADARVFEEATCLYNATCGRTSWEVNDPFGFSSSVAFMRFLGLTVTKDTTMDQVKAVFNPYRYGETIEITPTGNSKYTINKWFTHGRNAKELVYVMPDGEFSRPLFFHLINFYSNPHSFSYLHTHSNIFQVAQHTTPMMESALDSINLFPTR
jgi:secreted PhoX family phosphatase